MPTACRLAGCLAPRGSERPPRLGQAALCAWRVLPPRTSLPRRRGPASRQPGGPRHAPRPPPRAPRLPEGGPASAPGPAAAASRAGGARAVGGRGGRARGAARPEVAPPGDRCALGGLGPGLRSPRRCFSPFWPRAAGGAGRAAPAPATPRGQASGKRRRRAQRARLRVASCGTAPVTAQTLRGPRGSRLGPGSWEPKTAAHFRRQEQRSPLTCGPDSRLARPRGRSGSPGPGARRRQPRRRRQVRPRPAAGARADPSVSLCARRLVGVPEGPALSPVGSRPLGLGAGAKPALPTRTGLVPQGLVRNSAAPRGARGSSGPRPKLFLFLQESCRDSAPNRCRHSSLFRGEREVTAFQAFPHLDLFPS